MIPRQQQALAVCGAGRAAILPQPFSVRKWFLNQGTPDILGFMINFR
jgi:hypothetical protein